MNTNELKEKFTNEEMEKIAVCCAQVFFNETGILIPSYDDLVRAALYNKRTDEYIELLIGKKFMTPAKLLHILVGLQSLLENKYSIDELLKLAIKCKGGENRIINNIEEKIDSSGATGTTSSGGTFVQPQPEEKKRNPFKQP